MAGRIVLGIRWARDVERHTRPDVFTPGGADVGSA
jgi:hypothetical protein